MKRRDNWRQILQDMSARQVPYTAVEIRDAICEKRGLASEAVAAVRTSGIKLIELSNVRNGQRRSHAKLFRIEFPK